MLLILVNFQIKSSIEKSRSFKVFIFRTTSIITYKIKLNLAKYQETSKPLEEKPKRVSHKTLQLVEQLHLNQIMNCNTQVKRRFSLNLRPSILPSRLLIYQRYFTKRISFTQTYAQRTFSWQENQFLKCALPTFIIVRGKLNIHYQRSTQGKMNLRITLVSLIQEQEIESTFHLNKLKLERNWPTQFTNATEKLMKVNMRFKTF